MKRTSKGDEILQAKGPASPSVPDSTHKPLKRLGVAEGKFVVPDDIDSDNDLIAGLFEGRSPVGP